MKTDEIKKQIGQNIRTLRESRNLSQWDLCCEMDVTRETIWHWENGISSVRSENIWKLAKIFEVPITRFFEGLV